MSASPFSFHCMICIEEFHAVERYPVVLPCGHTYLCNICAERLDRCMECRTPLTYIVNPALQQQQQTIRWNERQRLGTPSNGARRYSPHSPARQPPLPPPEKKRLPLPKNVVLLSLMEATELVSESAVTPTGSQTSNNVIEQQIDESEDEARISVGTSLATSMCGTYMVTVREGMEIYPCRPDEALGSPSSVQHSHPTDEDVDTLVRFFHLDNHLNASGSNFTDSDSVAKEFPPAQLKRGDRVQIVSVEHGWAKLARGYGYLRTDGGQLAKVGGPLDRACTLEALLRTLSYRRRELKREHRRANKQFVDLMGDLQNSLINDEDLTVICAQTFGDNPDESWEEPPQEEEKENAKLEVKTDFSHDVTSPDLTKPHALVRQDSPPLCDQAASLSCFSVQVFPFSTPPSETRNDTSTRASNVLETLTEALSFDHLTCEMSPSQGNRSQLPTSRPHPSPGSMAAGARAWRQENGESVAARGIDWRTGMSGHSALSSGRSSRSRDQAIRNGRRMNMSAHTGLTIPRPRIQQDQSFQEDQNGTLTIPSLSEEHEQEQDVTTLAPVRSYRESGGAEEMKEELDEEDKIETNEVVEIQEDLEFFVGTECF